MISNEIGAYLLGASIAKSIAESRARHEAKMAKIAFDGERAQYRQIIDRTVRECDALVAELQQALYYEAISSQVRKMARLKTGACIAQLMAMAEDGEVKISKQVLKRLFAHEVEPEIVSAFFVEKAVEIANSWIKEMPADEKPIRQALEKIILE